MVLFEIDPQRSPLVPLEGDAPRPVHMDRIAPWPKAAQRVEVEARLIERFKTRRFVDRIQTDERPAMQIGANMGAVAGLEQFPRRLKPFQCGKVPLAAPLAGVSLRAYLGSLSVIHNSVAPSRNSRLLITSRRIDGSNPSDDTGPPN
jgi:hypothetical protein